MKYQVTIKEIPEMTVYYWEKRLEKYSDMMQVIPEIGEYEYVVPPLEGFWWQDGIYGVDYSKKDEFNWISIIRLPDFITRENFDWAVKMLPVQ